MITKNLKNFNLRQIADSGQCFRMIPCAPNDPQTAYRVISSGHFLIVEQNRDEVIFHCPDDESAFWNHYFDLGTDYGAYIRTVDPADEYLSKAAGFRQVDTDPEPGSLGDDHHLYYLTTKDNSGDPSASGGAE